MKYKHITFVTEDYGPTESHIYTMEVLDTMTEPDVLKAIKDASSEFLHTKEGRKYLKSTNGCFNYGDALTEIPDWITKKHGFIVHEMNEQETITVDHNTDLVPYDLL